MADLNLELPGDAEQVGFQGVGGASTGHKFVVDELRLGPIIMRNIPVVVDTGSKGAIGGENAREGLLGQEFFSSWRFAVDNKNQRLRLFH
ncbi:MAG: retropepsin-like domain-containing protein [Candidatus Obscuribacterales bacterium]|nr:retropepsin-like domain-containing protein [Candidatus Obscuribacterales bacterium]